MPINSNGSGTSFKMFREKPSTHEVRNTTYENKKEIRKVVAHMLNVVSRPSLWDVKDA
jgi:hypothetical protein